MNSISIIVGLFVVNICFGGIVPMVCDNDNDYITTWDALWTYSRSIGGFPEILSGIGSKHDNYYEDRIFKFRSCWPLNQNDRVVEYVSDLLPDQTGTDWDAKWTLECPSNSAITYLRSEHHNYFEDRIYTMQCKRLKDSSMTNCAWSGTRNGYDAEFWYQCPNNGVITGISSWHHNYYEDRQYNFKCCQIQK